MVYAVNLYHRRPTIHCFLNEQLLMCLWWVVRGDPGGDPAQGGGGGGGPGGGVGPLQWLPALALPTELLHDGLPCHRQPRQHPGQQT